MRVGNVHFHDKTSVTKNTPHTPDDKEAAFISRYYQH